MVIYSLNLNYYDFYKPKVGLNVLPMFRLCHNLSFEPLILPHFSTQTKDMYRGTNASNLIEFQCSNGVLIGNRCLYIKSHAILHKPYSVKS